MSFALAADDDVSGQAYDDQAVELAVDELDEAMYSPFIERYILDDLRSLRVQMAEQRNDLQQQILDREHQSVDRAVTYATDTVTYFFYLVAAASSILVAVGWTSIRDIKERVHSFANTEISKLIEEYESRLQSLENQLRAKSVDIAANKEDLETAKEVQSLWLRAQQELTPSSKIVTYDQILSVSPEDTEALTYKADAVLELSEPLWAINLCNQALDIDQENSHAHYQLGCAYTLLDQYDDAVKSLIRSVEINASYREEIFEDEILQPLHNYQPFKDYFEDVES
ncbi:tetratricopeptide repeat protein [Reinekea thalattae]|uniref:Uncharacterized protein n=1 Tax=Reinekea thalattae TaxID=2593301 RepID=A0A5C8ZAL1_9GAMM|nr:tetratricopeptide repeat protein [Reinekea thalattae]TXR54474.1 hypothetical protein FME95_08045 [Reinekea thalattae]